MTGLNESTVRVHLFRAIRRLRAVLAPGAALFGPPRGALREAAEAAGLRYVAEGFIDRAYRGDGTLVPRGEPGAVLHDEADAVAQALRLARGGGCETLCVHGDGSDALRLLRAARAALVADGFTVSAPWASESGRGTARATRSD